MGSTDGTVLAIFTTEEAKAEMKRRKSVLAIAGKGLRGDRYSNDAGSWSGPGKMMQVSLISAEAIREANQGHKEEFEWGDTRRNIVVDIGPDSLIALTDENLGRKFMIGRALMRADSDCTPCEEPTKLSGKGERGTVSGFKERFNSRGGIRAEVLRGGRIQEGDSIYLL